jgi:hypothetical protein
VVSAGASILSPPLTCSLQGLTKVDVRKNRKLLLSTRGHNSHNGLHCAVAVLSLDVLLHAAAVVAGMFLPWLTPLFVNLLTCAQDQYQPAVQEMPAARQKMSWIFCKACTISQLAASMQRTWECLASPCCSSYVDAAKSTGGVVMRG